jgi:hypothetical protein
MLAGRSPSYMFDQLCDFKRGASDGSDEGNRDAGSAATRTMMAKLLKLDVHLARINYFCPRTPTCDTRVVVQRRHAVHIADIRKVFRPALTGMSMLIERHSGPRQCGFPTSISTENFSPNSKSIRTAQVTHCSAHALLRSRRLASNSIAVDLSRCVRVR